MSNRSMTLLGSAVAAALAGAPALAQSEFLMYPCDADVTGTILAEAGIAAVGHGSSVDQDTASLAGSFTPPFAYPFAFSDGVSVAAAVSRSFVQNGCPTVAEAEVSGSTRYGFVGEQYRMSFETGSGRRHAGAITRGPFSIGPGDAATTDSLYVMPHSDNYRAEVPFVVGGGNGGHLVVNDFVLSRTDTGPTLGYTYLSWDVVADANGNCVADLDEDVIASGGNSVGPNEQVQVPDTRFAVPRGYYVLRIYHRPYSYLGTGSAECADSVAERSRVEDSCRIRFDLY